MATRIYVGNLSRHTRGEQLRQIFETFGKVSLVDVKIDRKTKKPKGFCFVDMPSDSEAKTAIDSLNGTVVDGSSVVVNMAPPREASIVKTARSFEPLSCKENELSITKEDNFRFDVFLSHSSKDKNAVKKFAETFRLQGFSVWFDDWQINVGDSIPEKIEEGLANSRVLVLFLSKNSLGSDWVKLESGTYRFRDPLNRSRRFVPVRLDDSPLTGTIAQFRNIAWFEGNFNANLSRLLTACKPFIDNTPLQKSDQATNRRRFPSLHTDASSKTFDYCESIGLAAAANRDGSIAVMRMADWTCVLLQQVHNDEITAISFSQTGALLATGSRDLTIKIWRTKDWSLIHSLQGHMAKITALSWGPNELALSSVSDDGTARVWDTKTGYRTHIFKGSNRGLNAGRLSNSGTQLVVGGRSKVLRLFDLVLGQQIFEVFLPFANITCIDWCSDQRKVVVGFADGSVRLVDITHGDVETFLRCHDQYVSHIQWLCGETLLLTTSKDMTVRLWKRDENFKMVESHQLHEYWVASAFISASKRSIYSMDRKRFFVEWIPQALQAQRKEN